ncbi:MAG: PAS domain S-box protein [Thaumarchaeota archaeon]|nr:PAS domain S-box protein [Nitrososphaerota archaeon]
MKPIHILTIISVSTLALVLFIVFYAQEQLKQETRIIDTDRIISLKQIASTTELRFSDATKVLQTLSRVTTVTDPRYISLVDKNLHGVPENNATNERNLFTKTLQTYEDFESITHVLSNGAVYLEEPYPFQKNNLISNYGNTTWFIIMSSTLDTYVSSITTSDMTGKKIAMMGVPIFSQHGNFTGFLTGTLDLSTLQNKLYNVQSYANGKFLIIDDERNIVASSDNDTSSYLNLSSISASLSGGSGTSVENVNGTKMYVSYYPLYITGSSPWAIILIQPYDDAFHEVNSSIRESEILIVAILLVSTISSFFIVKSFRTQHDLAMKLKESNTILEKSQEELHANHITIQDYLEEISKIKNALYQSAIVAITDKNGTIIEANENFCTISKYSHDELIGENHSILKSGYHTQQFYAELWETISNGKIWQGEFKNRSKDGSFYWSKTIIIPHVKDNEITEYVSIGINITREKELLVKLDNSQKLATIGELSARVAHDIRNPLSIIKNNFELLEHKDPKFANKHKDALERIKRAILRITHQVDNVLDYVRPPTLTLKQENLRAITKSALEKVDAPDGIKIKYFKKDIFLVCDYLKIEVVLINIITNAIQAMGLRGKLDITCDKHEDHLVMEIRDTGPGIPENILSKIFDPLFTTKQIGTGLGLSSCKSIVEYHGGKISVKSMVGSGTSFIIILPLDLKK